MKRVLVCLSIFLCFSSAQAFDCADDSMNINDLDQYLEAATTIAEVNEIEKCWVIQGVKNKKKSIENQIKFSVCPENSMNINDLDQYLEAATTIEEVNEIEKCWESRGS